MFTSLGHAVSVPVALWLVFIPPWAQALPRMLGPSCQGWCWFSPLCLVAPQVEGALWMALNAPSCFSCRTLSPSPDQDCFFHQPEAPQG